MRAPGAVVAWAAALAVSAGGSTAAADPVATLTAYVAGNPEAALAPLRAGVDDTFAGDGRLAYRPIGALLPEAKADPAAELAKADAELDEGDKAFSGMDIEPAKQRLAAAVARYRAWLPELAARDGSTGKLRTAWLLSAKVAFFDGDAEQAKAALRHCLTLDPALRFDKSVFPPQMKKLVTATRAEYDAAGKGAVLVTSTPPGATVYVDGAAWASPAPQTIELPAGPHDLRLDLPAHEPGVEAIDVAGGGAAPAEVAVVLAAAPSRAEALLGPAFLHEGDVSVRDLARAAHALGVDLVALVRATAAAEGKVELRGWLYDARRDLVLKRATREAGGGEDELRLGGRYFARELTTGVRLDGRAEPPPHRATVGERWDRFAGSKWFWPVVGVVGGLAVAGAAVAIGVGVARQRSIDDDAAAAVVLTGGR